MVIVVIPRATTNKQHRNTDLFVLAHLDQWITYFFCNSEFETYEHLLNLNENTASCLTKCKINTGYPCAVTGFELQLFNNRDKTFTALLLLFAATGVEKGKEDVPPAYGIAYVLHVTGEPSTAIPHSVLPKLLRIAELVQ